MTEEVASPETKTKSIYLRIWDRSWAWLLSPEVQKRTIYVLIVIFLLYLPLPYLGRVVQDWFWDRGLFFDPKHEGAIIIESPQLFTRERLINQRLSDSDWIEDRIKAVGTMLKEKRFGLPDSVRTGALEKRFGLGIPTLPKTDADGEGSGSGEGKKGDQPAINVNPRTEFTEAYEFREYLVQKKYESVLDDAHDTHSNTLHRLNLNLFVSPGRKYSSSIAAVSVRIQQPSDPQWILQKYGALLVDIREELENTANRLVQDRFTILRPENTTTFPSETDRLLRREIETLTAKEDFDHAKLILDTTSTFEVEYERRSAGEFKRQIRELAPGTDIGILLETYLFPPQTSQRRATTPGQIAVAKILPQLQGQCREKVDLLALLPSEFFNAPIYGQLTDELRKRWHLVSSTEFSDNGELDLALRKILHASKLQVACGKRSENMASIAMLEVLGRFAIKDKLPVWANECFPKANQTATEYLRQVFIEDKFFSNPNEKYQECSRLRNKLPEIGVVHLVKAELANTPIDSVGRVRRLDHYFHLDAEDCDLGTCKIAVKTISERERDKYAKEAKDNKLKPGEIQRVQGIGNNEALRLFAELSCFSNARSYTVYPRKGLGRNIREEDSEERSLFGIFGNSNATISTNQIQLEQIRQNSIFGIGASGKEPRNQELECGPSFLKVLNSIQVDAEEDLVSSLGKMLEDDKSELDPHWKDTIKCLLAVEISRTGNKIQERENCKKADAPTVKGWSNFSFYDLTSVVRYLRQRDTTVSWVVHPVAKGIKGQRHEVQSEPLSALVSIPSWWPGLELVIETCWVRPRWIGGDSSKGLCQASTDEDTGILTTLFDGFIRDAKARGRVENAQVLPLPLDLDDVLPKLGFFIVRYPYVDHVEATDISLETGRKVEMRLTGKRLWKNPRVRIGEQWHTRVEVLPDMRGIIATFDCLAPLQRPLRKFIDNRHLVPIEPSTEPMLAWSGTSNNSHADERYTELRQVQVWTSEGKTNPTNVQVRAFRPMPRSGETVDDPCWPIQKATEK